VKANDTPLPFYLCCQTCGERIPLGLDCDLTQKRLQELMEAAQTHEMTTAAFQRFAPLWVLPIGVFTNMLCFIRQHGGHQLSVWTTEDLDQSPAQYREGGPFPSGFFGVEPLPLPEIEATLREKNARLQRDVQQLRYALTTLQMQGATSTAEREELVRSLRAMYPDDGPSNVVPTARVE
jgi:hypothetical protein